MLGRAFGRTWRGALLEPRPQAEESLRLAGRVCASKVAVGLAEKSGSSAGQGN